MQDTIVSLLKMVDIADRSQGCLLGLLVGDALGASAEGFTAENVAEIAASLPSYQHGYYPFLRQYIPAIHMGTVIPLSKCPNLINSIYIL